MNIAQAEIWTTPGELLREKDWIENGYTSLADYVVRTIEAHDGHNSQFCIACDKHKSLPLASFGTFDPKTGGKTIKLTCQTKDDLPKSNLEGILEFNEKN